MRVDRVGVYNAGSVPRSQHHEMKEAASVGGLNSYVKVGCYCIVPSTA
jgi:hypothetical protein